jgi:hypothetical protein
MPVLAASVIAAVLSGLAIRNLSTRTPRSAIGAAAVVPALLIGVLGSKARTVNGIT